MAETFNAIDKSVPYFELNQKQQDVLSWHTDIEITFILNGTGIVKDSFGHHQVKSEDIFLINSGDLHSLEMSPGSATISLMIPITFLAIYVPELTSHFWDCRSYLYDEYGQQKFNKVRSLFCELYIAGSEGNNNVSFRTYLLLLCSVLESNFRITNTGSLVNEKGKDMYDILQYISDHYQEEISLSAVVQIVHLSESYTSRLFRREMNMTFTDYLTSLRLSKAASLLRNTEYSITDVAYRCGFSSANAFIRSFKKSHGITPGKYRSKANDRIHKLSDKKLHADGSIISSLLKYHSDSMLSYNKDGSQLHHYQISELSSGKTIIKPWNKIASVNSAHDILSSHLQQQLRQMQKEMHFNMCRFLGITSDSMMLYNLDNDGNVFYYYDLIDECLNFLLSIDLKPYIVLCYMPERLARAANRAYFSPVYVEMPKDMHQWEDMIKNLMQHLIDRFGKSEIHQWYFTIWGHPEVGELTFRYSRQDFLSFYLHTFRTIKSVDPEIIITGPDCRIESWNYTRQFLEYSRENQCMPDIYSFQYFSFEDPNLHDLLKVKHSMYTLNGVISNDPSHLSKQLKRMHNLLDEYDADNLPVIISCWSNTSNQRDLRNDTAAKSAWLYNDAFQAIGLTDAMAYWFCFDYVTLAEVPPSTEQFSGSYGLMTRNGIPKSSWYAYSLLSKANGTLLLNEDGIAVFKNVKSIQIYFYNSAVLNNEYRYQFESGISSHDRYRIYQKKEKQHYVVEITDMAPGITTIVTYSIGRNAGSTYDKWVEMGAPQNMNSNQLDYLRAVSIPDYHIERVSQDGKLRIDRMIDVHEVKMVEISL